MSSGQPVVIPDGKLQTRAGQVGQGQVIPPQSVLPSGADGLPADWSLLFVGTIVGWQKVTETKKYEN